MTSENSGKIKYNYVINLNRRTDRWNNITKIINDTCLKNHNFIRFSAIDGNNFNEAFVAIEHAITGRQLRLGAMVASGASVAWLQQNILKGEQSVEQLSKDAQDVAPGAEG